MLSVDTPQTGNHSSVRVKFELFAIIGLLSGWLCITQEAGNLSFFYDALPQYTYTQPASRGEQSSVRGDVIFHWLGYCLA